MVILQNLTSSPMKQGGSMPKNFDTEPEWELQKTPETWAAEKHMKILDTDGWRLDNKDFKEPITEAEFFKRIQESTTLTFPKSI